MNTDAFWMLTTIGLLMLMLAYWITPGYMERFTDRRRVWVAVLYVLGVVHVVPLVAYAWLLLFGGV